MFARPLVVAAFAIVVCACEPKVTEPPAADPSVFALYDPTATPPALPTPNDLLLAAVDGGEAPAGFAPTSEAHVRFSSKLDASTVNPAALVVVNLKTGAAIAPADLVLKIDVDGKGMSVASRMPWADGTYAATVWGGDDAMGVRGEMGERVIAAPAFYYLRSQTPILGTCGRKDAPECACPQAIVDAANPDDETCHAIAAGLSDASARQLEKGRRAMDALLTAVTPAARVRANVVAAWTFTIASDQ